MAVKKNVWSYIIPACGKKEIKPKTPQKVLPKPTSFPRLSLSDLSNPSSLFSEDLSISLAGSKLHVFTRLELKVMTQNFSSSNFLGEGGFGPVHKGFIDDKLRPGLKAQPVAVKLLDPDGLQGHKEWLMSTGSSYTSTCLEEAWRISYSEVRTQLSPSIICNCRKSPFLANNPWSARMKIALGAAKGLAFLTAMSDVYSFGVVLLELLTGRKSVDKNRPSREQKLIDWARPMLNDQRKLSKIMDPRLEEQYSEKGARKAAALAYQCLSHRPKQRPTMRTVTETLEPLLDFDDILEATFVYTVPESDLKKEDRDSQGKKEFKEMKEQHNHYSRRRPNRRSTMSAIHSDSDASLSYHSKRNVLHSR